MATKDDLHALATVVSEQSARIDTLATKDDLHRQNVLINKLIEEGKVRELRLLFRAAWIFFIVSTGVVSALGGLMKVLNVF